MGCGSWAEYTHLPCIKKCDGVSVISCADINIKNAESLSKKFGIPLYFSDYKEMLEKTNPDAVICLVSENAMAKVAGDILKNYPVMLEKPPGVTVEEANIISEAAKKSGKTHMVAFNRRFAPVYVKLKEQISADKNNNNIKYINYKLHRIKRHESTFETTAIHAVDAVKFLAGSDFKRVEIKYQEMPELGEKVANYFIFFEFINGIYASAEILVSTGELSESCEIHAGNNIYRASLPLALGPEPGQPEHYMTQGFYHEHEHFYKCLRNKTNPGNGADTAVQSVAVCGAIKNRESLLVF